MTMVSTSRIFILNPHFNYDQYIIVKLDVTVFGTKTLEASRYMGNSNLERLPQ